MPNMAVRVVKTRHSRVEELREYRKQEKIDNNLLSTVFIKIPQSAHSYV